MVIESCEYTLHVFWILPGESGRLGEENGELDHQRYPTKERLPFFIDERYEKSPTHFDLISDQHSYCMKNYVYFLVLYMYIYPVSLCKRFSIQRVAFCHSKVFVWCSISRGYSVVN